MKRHRRKASSVSSLGNKVRLKYGYVVECQGAEKDANGNVTEVPAVDLRHQAHCADSVKVKGVITWVGAADGVPAEVRLYDRLFTDPQPDAGGKDFLASLNPASLRTVTAYVEPSLAHAARTGTCRPPRPGPVRAPHRR